MPDETQPAPAAKKPAPNSVKRGSVPVWPVLRPAADSDDPKDVARLVADRVRTGDHDDMLSELYLVENGHDKREVVIDALRSRHKALKLELPALPLV